MLLTKRLANNRGAVSIWVALSLVPTLMLLALALDEGRGSLAAVTLQNDADRAAIAGGLRAASAKTGVPSLCSGATYDLDCAYANAAADLAEINSAATTSDRVWDDDSKTLTDDRITAAIVSGIKTSTDTAVKVTMSQSIPALLGFAVGGGSSYRVAAGATAEVIPGSTSGPQPCMLALDGSSNGVTVYNNIAISGNVNLTMNGCSMRSDGAIALSGNVNIVADGIYAASSVTTSGNVNLTGTQYPNSGQISDPLASYAALQTALADLTTQSSTSFSGGGTLSPGTYANVSITANTTLSAGLYVVTGSLSVSGSASVSGSGVTIIVGGSTSISGSVNFNVTAPGSSVTGGAVPGVLLASNGTGGLSISGSASSAISGILYFPNAQIAFSGTGATNGQDSCMEVIANTVAISGNTNFGGNCSALGAPAFGSLPAVPTVELVQ